LRAADHSAENCCVGESTIRVSIGDGVFVCTIVGRAAHADTLAAQRELDRLAAEHPDIDCIVYDGRALEGFEAGLPVRWIEWAKSRGRKSRRVAFVGNYPRGICVLNTFRYLLPSLPFGVFRDIPNALEFLHSTSKRASRTGTHGVRRASI
jgi:hypothetical protein